MKKTVLIVAVALGLLSNVYAQEGEAKTSATTVEPTQAATEPKAEEAQFEKQGFLTTKWCADQGLFADCRLESIVCGEGGCYRNWEFGDAMKTELVIFVHSELKYYIIKPEGHFEMGELIEKGMAKDLVTIQGKYDEKSNTIATTGFKAPPPPAKSFFKGCL